MLALTLNWTVFQTLVLDLSARAPTELASAIVGPQFAPLERLQTAYDQMRADQVAFGKLAQSDATSPNANAAQAAGELSYATNALLAATGGLLAFATVVTGVLAMVGPIFLTLFLFESAGGLFAGWVRAISAAALVPMLCWITTIILLATIEPRLDVLDQQKASGTLDASEALVTCFIVYVFAAAQFGLVIAAGIVAIGFRLPVRRKAEAPAVAARHRLRARHCERHAHRSAGARLAALVEHRQPSRAIRLRIARRRRTRRTRRARRGPNGSAKIIGGCPTDWRAAPRR